MLMANTDSKLEILSDLPAGRALVKCACGVEKSVRKSHVISGKTKTCGSRECISRAHDWSGRRFGSLTVTGRAESGFTSSGVELARWECRCDCGNTTTSWASHLRAGNTKSCGCGRKLAGRSGAPPAIRGERWVALGHDRFARVSESDFDKVEKATWHLDSTGYPAARINGRTMRLHAVLLPTAHGFVDHIDGDKLNNTRGNLRVASLAESARNQTARSGSRSRFKGVDFVRGVGKWRARVRADGRVHHVGLFDTEEAAAKAYDESARGLHGAFGRYNFPLPGERSAARGVAMLPNLQARGILSRQEV